MSTRTLRYRKLNRLKEYDYAQDGYYFITICAKNRIECLGKIKNGEMKLNQNGKIAEKQLLWLPDQYKYVKLDIYCVMPNHIHGIIIIDNFVGTGREHVGTGRDLSLRYNNAKIKSLSELIGAFKTTSSKLIHQNGFWEFAWQRSFYDHIIRNEKSLLKIREYLANNSLKWEIDRNNAENLLM